MTADAFTEAARAEAGRYWLETLQDETVGIGELGQHMAEWARGYLAAQEESVLMDPLDERIADRLANAGYLEYAADEDGEYTMVLAPLGEVLYVIRLCLAAQEPTDACSCGRSANDGD